MTLQIEEPQSKRWTREEYYRLAEEGWFRGLRVQLIEGEIIQMPPQGHAHSFAIMKLTRWLHNAYGTEAAIRIQMPLNAMEHSDPEPDAAVIAGSIDNLRDHPETAILAIEVSDSSLALDRKKALIYAAAGVPEYWIVDVEHRVVEVYRNPVADDSAQFGFRYAAPMTVPPAQRLSPLSNPDATLQVSDLFI